MKTQALFVMAALLLVSPVMAVNTYIGPYNIIFNDEDEPLADTAKSSMPIYLDIQGEELAIYASSFFGNNSVLYIEILESKSDKFTELTIVKNSTTLVAPNGYSQRKKEQRIIDGLSGTVAIFQNNSNSWLLQKAVLLCKVNSNGYSINTYASMSIVAINYNESQFDRLLDTFEFSRLKDA
ncbi:MAG: hypothetical protein PHQ34_16120 [Methanothrix sp.]|nr:hypothetical protein [Methanothrix sp.]